VTAAIPQLRSVAGRMIGPDDADYDSARTVRAYAALRSDEPLPSESEHPTRRTEELKMPAKKTAEPTVDGYFKEQPADKRALLEKLRALVTKGVPDATVSIKWGVPVYQRSGKNLCALAAFKDHVAINFFVAPSVLADPKKKLEGGKTNRLLKVRTAADIDAPSISRWLKAAAAANS
jgi:hypothetical protein